MGKARERRATNAVSEEKGMHGNKTNPALKRRKIKARGEKIIQKVAGRKSIVMKSG